jgi:hypothetical protein
MKMCGKMFTLSEDKFEFFENPRLFSIFQKWTFINVQNEKMKILLGKKIC